MLNGEAITSAFFQHSLFATYAIAIEQAVVVMGVGAVGLSAVMAAKVIGMVPIICVDLHAGRLELAEELGATHVLNIGDGGPAEHIKAVAPKGVRYAPNTSATLQGLTGAIAALGQGGKVGFVSYPNDGEPFAINTKELFLTLEVYTVSCRVFRYRGNSCQS